MKAISNFISLLDGPSKHASMGNRHSAQPKKSELTHVTERCAQPLVTCPLCLTGKGHHQSTACLLHETKLAKSYQASSDYLS